MGLLESSQRKGIAKGIIFAADAGERLHPMTQVVAKELIPVYDKPMIYYPLSTLILAGIEEILIVTAPRHLRSFMELLGNGSRLGLSISYATQGRGEGSGKTFLTAERFIGGESVCLIMGDSIFYGAVDFRSEAMYSGEGATLFACRVNHPEGHTVVEFDRDGKAVRLEEQPGNIGSNYAITGLCLYDGKVMDIARNLRSSPRGEIGIADVNREYLLRGELRVQKVGQDVAWFDAGTKPGLLEAWDLIAKVEKRQGLKVGCIEEAAFRAGLIDVERLERVTQELPEGSYREYLVRLVGSLAGRPQKLRRGRVPHPSSQALTATG